MKYFSYKDHKIFTNAEFVLFDLAEAKKGQDIVVIADADSYCNARALCDVAAAHGVRCIIIDIDHYSADKYRDLPIIRPLREAILHSDIAFMVTDQMKTDFGRFLGSIDDTDASLLGFNKRFTLEANGMEHWDLDKERILADRKRSVALHQWLSKAKLLRITTKRGTDITCEVGGKPDGMYPVMAIIPFYAEVAIVPSLGSVNGTVIADGASEFAYGQRGFPIRPSIPGYNEIYMDPMKLVFNDSMLVEYDGPAIQKERLDKLLAAVDPKPDICDEVGLVTCTSIENDLYGWRVCNSHQTHCIHVALGNNRRRKEIIHSTEHVDFDVHDPVIEVDGQVIYRDREFFDDIILAEH